MAARSRSPTDRARRIAYLLVGLVLVCNPFLLNAVGIGVPAYEYSVQAMTIEEGGRADERGVDNDLSRIDIAGEDTIGIRGIACDGRPPWARACLLERPSRDNRTVTSRTGPAFVTTAADYVALDGELYRRTAVERNDVWVYGLEAVAADEVIADIARSPGEFPDAVVAATTRLDDNASTTTVTVSQPSPDPPERIAKPVPPGVREGAIVQADGGYHYVRIRTVDTDGFRHDPDSPVRGAASVAGVLVGLGSLHRWYAGRQS